MSVQSGAGRNAKSKEGGRSPREPPGATDAHANQRFRATTALGLGSGSVRARAFPHQRVGKSLHCQQGAFGYNAATGQFGDMLEFGILDPTKVTRTALQNAASIAGLMITTEAMVADAPKKDEPAMPAGGGMGGMGGMDF